MPESAALQLNTSFPAITEHIEFPVQFLGKRTDKNGKYRYNPFCDAEGKPLARGMLKALSLIHTYNKRFGSDVHIPKSTFSRKLKMSPTTVRKALSDLEMLNIIKLTAKDTYKILPKIEDNDYIIIENYLHKKQFYIKGKVKRLSPTAVIVFERILRYWREIKYKAEKDGKNEKEIEKLLKEGQFYASEKSLATYLNLPKSTISYAVPQILKAGLMYRNKRLRYIDENGNVHFKVVQIKDVTGNAPSIFTINPEVLKIALQSERKEYEEIKVDPYLEEVEITETEIQQVYTELRTEAESNAKRATDKALSDPEFVEIREEMFNSGISTDYSGEERAAWWQHWDNLSKRYLNRLSELGISEQDFQPQYNCFRCGDTGTDSNTGQRCRCRIRIKQLIFNRKFEA